LELSGYNQRAEIKRQIMPLDEQLRRTFDALAERFRDEISRQLEAAAQDLTVSIGDDRAAAEASALDAGREIGREEGTKEGRERGLAEGQLVGLADGRQEGHAEGRQEGLAEGRQEGHAEGRQEGLAEGRQEGHAEGRQEGLAEGRQSGLDEGRREGRERARADLRAMELAASERLVASIRAMDQARSLSEILDTLVGCAGREAARVGVFLVRGDHLHGWRFIGFGPPLDDGNELQLLVSDAGIVGDALGAGAASGDSVAGTSAPSFADLPAGRDALAVPVPMGGRVVAVLYADQGAADPVGESDTPREAWRETLGVMTRHAGRCLEAMTAVRTAELLTGSSHSSSFAAEAAAGNAGTDGRAAEAASADGAAARRYARLLISEIKVYHEADVVAGRRERDLAMRLAAEIARARVLYERRVPARLRQSADYFHDELVSTLADGDAALVAQR
jgi:flagellar biosynthesis/type III secretory pathway protein FliH